MAMSPLSATHTETVASSALRQIALDAPAYPNYKPLNPSWREIRVLVLGPGHQYSLRHVSLDENPKYTALSYYWGAPGVTKSIWINTHETHLRKTVYQFLKSLYRQFGAIAVWLDIVSINQRDVREQSSQVQMMGDIYQCAERVYSWLGNGNADIDYAFLSLLADSHDTQTNPGSGMAFSSNVRHHVTSGLRQLFSHPYWTRLWIIQECVLNRNFFLVCGSHSIAWSAIRDSGYAENEASPIPSGFGMTTEDRPDLTELGQTFKRFELERLRLHDSSGVKLRADSDADIPSIDHRFGLYPDPANAVTTQKGTLLDLLSRWGQAQCSEPIDKVYGLLALATDSKSFAVDYSLNRFDAVVRLVSAHEEPDYHRWHEQLVGKLSKWVFSDRNIILTGKLICHYVNMSADQILDGCQDQLTDNLTLECSTPAASLITDSRFPAEQIPLQWVEWILRNAPSFEHELLANPDLEATAPIEPPFERILRSSHRFNMNICAEILPDGHLGIVGTTLGSLVVDFNRINSPYAGDFNIRHILESHANFQRLSQKHTWPCKTKRAVHISRLLYAVLLHLDNARFGVVMDLNNIGPLPTDEDDFRTPVTMRIPKWLLEYGLANAPSSDIMVCRCGGFRESGIPDQPLVDFVPPRWSDDRAATRMHFECWTKSREVAKLFTRPPSNLQDSGEESEDTGKDSSESAPAGKVIRGKRRAEKKRPAAAEPASKRAKPANNTGPA